MNENSHIGGKAKNLNFLEKKGFNIPRFYVLNSDVSKGSLINLKIPILKSQKVIIRSSADIEDSESASFAGIFDSLVVENNEKEIKDGIKNVISALSSKKVSSYLKEQKINKFPKLNIIVQEYIEGDVSGVLFTRFKKEGKTGIFINANLGNAKSVVEGKNPESIFISDKKINQTSKKKILSAKEINLLIKESKKIEKLFGKPQDIEWTIKDSNLYILQSRPITASFEEELRVWDNSNIVESYSGIVLPLTISFARRAYKIAYINLVKTVGFSDKKIQKNKEVFENLLGFFYGRFYYNMLNWYKMAALFPGYEKTKENLNHMISAKTEADLDEEHKRNVPFLFKARYYGKILALFPLFSYRIKNFKKFVKNRFLEFRNINLSRLTAKKLISLYDSLENELLTRWSITLENDFLLMTYYGRLREHAKKHKIPEKDVLSSISNIKNVTSVKQVSFLKDLSNEFHKNKDLVSMANKKRYSKCLSQIKDNELYLSLKRKINLYLSIYGGRFPNELRLESKNLDEDPFYLINLLLLYGKSFKKLEDNKKAFEKRDIYLNFLINKIKYHARLREDLRLLRSQSFSIVREIFKEVGRKFSLEGTLKKEDDIFYLEIEEIKNYLEGSSSFQDLIQLVKLRKGIYKEFKKKKIDGLFSTSGEPYLSIPSRVKEKEKELSGEGCSPGIVKGRIKILKEFKLPKKGRYEIVVAKNTDPGWTPLFGLCTGLIVEQGGLLSHAAIVSRELRLPCVISVKNAASKLKDGQLVTINGSTGEIKVHGRSKNR